MPFSLVESAKSVAFLLCGIACSVDARNKGWLDAKKKLVEE
jgi:hypothetical protein